MCNRLHFDSQDIPESGKAWKVVQAKGRELRGMMGDHYIIDRDGWIRWSSRAVGTGFCACPTKEEADRLSEAWDTVPCLYKRETKSIPIEYRKGMGMQKELTVIFGMEFDTMIVGEWRPITWWNRWHLVRG